MRGFWHIFHLGIKELVSLWRDPVLLFLIAYTFTFSVYTPAKSAVMDVVNASIAIVDEDNSDASRAVSRSDAAAAVPAARTLIPFHEINRAMDRGRYTFVVLIPPEFQADLERGFAARGPDRHRRDGDEPGGPRAGLHPARSSTARSRPIGPARAGRRTGRSSAWRPARASTRTCCRAGSWRSTR